MSVCVVVGVGTYCGCDCGCECRCGCGCEGTVTLSTHQLWCGEMEVLCMCISWSGILFVVLLGQIKQTVMAK